MVHYLVCSFCGNETNALSIEDVYVQGVLLKGIKCNNPECGKYLGFYKDYQEELKEIHESIDEIESNMDD